MTFFYAQIDDGGIAFAVTQAAAAISAHGLVPLSSYDTGVLGKRWDGEQWHDVAPAAAVAAVVITSIAADPDHAAATDIATDLKSVDTSMGARLTFTAELRGSNDAVLPLEQTFRMPLVAADGSNDRRLIRVDFVQGVATFSVALTASRHWRVTQETINTNLPAEQQLGFAGLDVYVLE